MKYGISFEVPKWHPSMAVRVDWRVNPRAGAHIDCDWGREPMETLTLLCGGCIDAPDCVVSGSTLPNAVHEPYVRGVPRC